jgi:hypothetical protein
MATLRKRAKATVALAGNILQSSTVFGEIEESLPLGEACEACEAKKWEDIVPSFLVG